jgi:hypothetical protein
VFLVRLRSSLGSLSRSSGDYPPNRCPSLVIPPERSDGSVYTTFLVLRHVKSTERRNSDERETDGWTDCNKVGFPNCIQLSSPLEASDTDNGNDDHNYSQAECQGQYYFLSPCGPNLPD